MTSRGSLTCLDCGPQLVGMSLHVALFFFTFSSFRFLCVPLYRIVYKYKLLNFYIISTYNAYVVNMYWNPNAHVVWYLFLPFVVDVSSPIPSSLGHIITLNPNPKLPKQKASARGMTMHKVEKYVTLFSSTRSKHWLRTIAIAWHKPLWNTNMWSRGGGAWMFIWNYGVQGLQTPIWSKFCNDQYVRCLNYIGKHWRTIKWNRI